MVTACKRNPTTKAFAQTKPPSAVAMVDPLLWRNSSCQRQVGGCKGMAS